ncbi:hypothetical protein GCM10009836_43060 [Pseudonocardia ailaonensis]|uniref:Uncharacterized protein n=1 Tax=Pseudonocardia ailaonensis TaxID=367279 RepID=A0ABN2N8Z6_9PSEU
MSTTHNHHNEIRQDETDQELRHLLGLQPVRTVIYDGGGFIEVCTHCGHLPPVKVPPSLPPGEPTRDVVADPAALAAATRTVGGLVDVLDQRRPPKQLAELAAPQVLRYLRAVPTRRSGGRGGVRLLSLRCSQPHEEAVEVAGSVRVAGRPRALAASFIPAGPGPFVRRPTRWVCSTIRIL